MYKHFSDLTGQPIELCGLHGMKVDDFEKAFPGIAGRRYDSGRMTVGHPMTGGFDILPITRSINYKKRPSRHECDARCMHAKGRTMNCECSCGGVNHGRYT